LSSSYLACSLCFLLSCLPPLPHLLR
jgi:hypothetical protein